MEYSALILAAGKHAGKGISYEKALAEIEKGKSVLDKSVSIFLEDPNCVQIVIVTNSADILEIVKSHKYGKILHVKGGSTRRESVLLGLTAVSEDVVLIHDGVRPWVRHKYIDRLLEKMETEKAAVLAIKPSGSLLEIKDGYVQDYVGQTYYLTQTPQAYKTSFILKCYSHAERLGLDVLDDAELVRRVSDEKIAVVLGDRRNNRFIMRD